jgi:hypothetical protein
MVVWFLHSLWAMKYLAAQIVLPDHNIYVEYKVMSSSSQYPGIILWYVFEMYVLRAAIPNIRNAPRITIPIDLIILYRYPILHGNLLLRHGLCTK